LIFFGYVSTKIDWNDKCVCDDMKHCNSLSKTGKESLSVKPFITRNSNYFLGDENIPRIKFLKNLNNHKNMYSC